MDQRSESAVCDGHVEVIDPAAWDELQQILGSEADSVLRELIDAYLEDTMRLVSAIVIANQCQDTQAMITAAHALRSPSASLGALRLASLSGQVEEGLRSDPPQWPQNMVDQMLIKAGQTREALRGRRPVDSLMVI
ncbi:Hpt domain-containing protein [Microcystis elabens FACHB-917]|nr:Hpt domain-containing protein [Microcystis elabens FACHB-917]